MQKKMNRHVVEQILGSALSGTSSNTRTRLLSGRWSDTVDEAQWSEDAAVAIRELDIDWTTKKQARAALDRLKAGRYGVCESCGRTIGEARLAALPWATRCVRCAAMREYADRQRTKNPDGSVRELLDRTPDAA